MQVDLFLEDHQLLVHLNLQVVFACFDFGAQLMDFLQLLALELLPLIGCILGAEILDPLSLLNLKNFKLFAVVHSFFNSLIDGNQLLILLHLTKFRRWLDLDCFDSTVQLLVQHFHLLFVLCAEILHLGITLLGELFELVVPVTNELLEFLVTDLDVFLKLGLLDVRAKLVLVLVNVDLEEANLPHEVFIKLVLLNVAQFLGQDVNFLLDQGEHEDLLVLIQLSIATLVENVQEFVGTSQSQQVENLNVVSRC